jgi:hypothetical protein
LRVFEKRVARKISGPKWNEVTGQWRKIRNHELRDLFLSQNSMRNIHLRRRRWKGHVARTRKERGMQCFRGET